MIATIRAIDKLPNFSEVRACSSEWLGGVRWPFGLHYRFYLDQQMEFYFCVYIALAMWGQEIWSVNWERWIVHAIRGQHGDGGPDIG